MRLGSRPPAAYNLKMMQPRWLVAILLLVAAGPQDVPVARVRELVERLDADSSEDREKAAAELKRIGAAAVPELEKAEGSSRPELAGRAKGLLKVIRLRSSLSPELLAAVPGADERLANGTDEEWTRVFLTAAAAPNGIQQHPLVGGDDLEPLASRALTGAREDERLAMLAALGRFRIRSAAPQVARFISGEDDELREAALMALGEMGARDYSRVLEEFLTAPRQPVREKALWALGAMRSISSAPALQSLLDSTFQDQVPTAARFLGELDAQDAVPKLADLLNHADADVRSQAVIALGALGAKGKTAELVRLSTDRSPDVRLGVAGALGALEARDQADVLLRLLEDKDARVRRAAALSLGLLRVAASAPALVKVIDENVWFPLRSAAAGAVCELGSRDGVLFILEKSHEFAPLNALRRPGAWQQLSGRRVSREAEGSVRKLLEILAEDGSSTLVLPSEQDLEMRAALHRRAQLFRRGRSTPITEALRALTSGWAVIVVEDRSIRLIPRSEAAAFWKAWAAEPR